MHSEPLILLSLRDAAAKVGKNTDTLAYHAKKGNLRVYRHPSQIKMYTTLEDLRATCVALGWKIPQ